MLCILFSLSRNPEYCLSSTIDPHLDKLLTKNKSAVDKVNS